MTGWRTINFLSIIVLLAFMGLYGLYLTRMWAKGWWLGALLWPYAIFQELVLFILSIHNYWTGNVTWKGRSVTEAKSATTAIKR
jgi:hypothetical protein